MAAQITQEGFFCDFETRQPIDDQALPLIEEKMRGLIKSDLLLEQREMMRENAAELFRHHGLLHQVEQAIDADTPTVIVLHIGKFIDYLPEGELSTAIAECRAFKVLSIDRETRYVEGWGEIPVLRLKGTASTDLQSLKQLIKTMKAASKRDHRLLGEQMQLFRASDSLFPGSWSFLPKGVELCESLYAFWKSAVQAQGYQLVATPPLLLDETEGGLEFEEKHYAVLPAKAAAHARLFSEGNYKVPVKFAECAETFFPLTREKTEGLLMSRLQRVDALHLFCTQSQALQECISSLQFFEQTIKIFPFEPHWVLLDSRPIHAPVRQAEWRLAVRLLAQALEGQQIQAEKSSQLAAKQGPRLEMRVSDSLGRKWAVASLGVDVWQPAKLNRPFVMLTGSLFGSFERLIALMLENGADLNLLRRSKPG